MSFSQVADTDQEIFLNLCYEDLLALIQTNRYAYELCSTEQFWKKKYQRDSNLNCKPKDWTYGDYYKSYNHWLQIIRDKMRQAIASIVTGQDYFLVALDKQPYNTDVDYVDGQWDLDAVWLSYDEGVWNTRLVVEECIDITMTITITIKIDCEEPVAECALNRFIQNFGLQNLNNVQLIVE